MHFLAYDALSPSSEWIYSSRQLITCSKLLGMDMSFFSREKSKWFRALLSTASPTWPNVVCVEWTHQYHYYCHYHSHRYMFQGSAFIFQIKLLRWILMNVNKINVLCLSSSQCIYYSSLKVKRPCAHGHSSGPLRALLPPAWAEWMCARVCIAHIEQTLNTLFGIPRQSAICKMIKQRMYERMLGKNR